MLPVVAVLMAIWSPQISGAHYYNYTFGAIAAGHDLLQQQLVSVEAAKSWWCATHPSCNYAFRL